MLLMGTSIGIGLCTYQRPEGLRAALGALSKLRAPKNVSLLLCVGDSDPLRSAEQIVHETAADFPYPIAYESAEIGHLPTRNAVLECLLKASVSYIAFCDDDAEVDPDWLEVLYEALQKYEVEVVTDYVRVQCVDPRAPRWMRAQIEGLLYIRPIKTPQLLRFARSGNVLFKASVADRLRFDTSFMGYGEDTYFFLRAHLRGARILGLASYKIRETWPLSRTSWSFLCRRHYLIGMVSSLTHKKVYGQKGKWLSLMTGLKKMAYAPIHPFCAYFGTRVKSSGWRFYLAQGVLLWIRGVGHLVGLWK